MSGHFRYRCDRVGPSMMMPFAGERAECMEIKSNAERFMVYQIGVMLHVLMEGDKVNKPHGTAFYKNQDELGTIGSLILIMRFTQLMQEKKS